MSDMSWEHASEARAALNAIVSDPDHGVPALSNPSTMSNLLKDYLPDAPREKSILVAAAEAGLADTLRQHIDEGMDPSTAIRLTASTFASSTPFTPEACNWVTDEIAVALGVSQGVGGDPGAGSGGLLGGAPPGFAPVSNEGATQMAPVAPGGYSPGQPGNVSPGQPGDAGHPTQPGNLGAEQGNLQQTAPGQPSAQEQPTAPGYRPGYAPQQGMAGAVGPVGGAGQVPGQGYPGQGYPGQPGPGYPGQPRQAYQAQPGFAQSGFAQPGFAQPGFPQQGFPQQGFPPGQAGVPGGWQPAAYGPGGGFGGPPKSTSRRRGLMIVGGILLLVIVSVGAAVALAHKPPKPVESLPKIMNPVGFSAVGTQCSQAILFGLNGSTLTHRIFCSQTTSSNIDVWGYQFDSNSDYLTGLAHINSYTGFHKTSSSCPPAAGSDGGETGWHANNNPKYAARPGQTIECFVDNRKPLLIWTMPTMNVFFIAQDRGTGDTIPRIVGWWKTVNYG